MNQQHFVPSYYYPTESSTEQVAALPDQEPVAAPVFENYQQPTQQIAQNYFMAAPHQQHRREVAPAPEPTLEPLEYKEPVASSYFADETDIPAFYREKNISMQMLVPSIGLGANIPHVPPPYSSSTADVTMTNQGGTVQQEFAGLAGQDNEPIPQVVPQDYFKMNSLQTNQYSLNVHPVTKSSGNEGNTYKKMYPANPSEGQSYYAFENQEDTKQVYTKDYNTLDNIPAFSPAPIVSDVAVCHEAVHISKSAPPFESNTVIAQQVQQEINNKEQSDYVSFKNDVVAAYGGRGVSEHNRKNQTLVDEEEKKLIDDCVTALETLLQPETPRNNKAETPVLTAKLELENVIKNASTQFSPVGHAFDAVSMSAPSFYQHENMNNLVSCAKD